MHWFKFDEFYAEAIRVSKPAALIAAWCYSLLRISKDIDPLIEEFHYKTLKDYWDGERKDVDEAYRIFLSLLQKQTQPLFIQGATGR